MHENHNDLNQGRSHVASYGGHEYTRFAGRRTSIGVITPVYRRVASMLQVLRFRPKLCQRRAVTAARINMKTGGVSLMI